MDHMAIVERLSKDSKIHNTAPYCWEWNGFRNPKGYGRVWFEGKLYLVHRLAMHAFFEFRLDSGYDVMHKCDNPRCWNPEHIISCTTAQNNADRHAKGNTKNGNSGATHCKHGHEFTPENTIWCYANRRTATKRMRQCKECHRLASVKSRVNKKLRWEN